jgi:hypothetical protein
VRVALLHAIETGLVVPEAGPIDLAIRIGQGGVS